MSDNLRHTRLVSADGATNTLTIAQPTTDLFSDHLVLCIPAMGVRARNYHKLLNVYADSGMYAATYDLRGVGDSNYRARNGDEYGYYEYIEQDLPAALEALRQEFPFKTIVLHGHSMGGQIALHYASTQAAKFPYMILTASGTIHYKAWPFPANLMTLLFAQFIHLVTLVCGFLPGDKIGFGGEAAKRLIDDWARFARTGSLQPDKSELLYADYLGELKSDTLSITFNQDLYAPKRAAKALMNLAPNIKISEIEIDAKRLDLQKADHFSWLKSPQAVVAEALKWLTRRIDSEFDTTKN